MRMAAMAFGCIKRGSTVEPIFTECLKEHTEKRLKTQTSLTACMQAWVAKTTGKASDEGHAEADLQCS